jgi:hypothetical protein
MVLENRVSNYPLERSAAVRFLIFFLENVRFWYFAEALEPPGIQKQRLFFCEIPQPGA